MVIVDVLDKRLDPGSLGNTFLSHTRSDLQGRFSDTSDQGVRIRTFLCAFVKVLDNDSLFSGESSTEDENDLSGFDEFDWEGE